MKCKHGWHGVQGYGCPAGCHQYVASDKMETLKTQCVHGYDPAEGNPCCVYGCHTPIKGKGTRCEHGNDPNRGDIVCELGCHNPKQSKLDSDRLIVVSAASDEDEGEPCTICKADAIQVYIVFPLADISMGTCIRCGSHLGTKLMLLLG